MKTMILTKIHIQDGLLWLYPKPGSMLFKIEAARPTRRSGMAQTFKTFTSPHKNWFGGEFEIATGRKISK